MAYETYTTKALVCGTKNRNTADRSYLLFTREAGMLFADARSVREERSRQRYALQDFSLIRVSLVKGKAGWKIGSIEPLTNLYHAAEDKVARGSVVRVVRLLRRFLHGEEAAQELFDLVTHGLTILKGEVPERAFVEQVLLVQILAELGYVATKDIPEPLQRVAPEAAGILRSDALASIVDRLYTHAVSVSHL
ncbi:recombination protein O N-terminal domain-containing protein [Candidatus Nomurabacteria bacterium]|nr:recombination protein O N-terminal domain-containing protein [Candidatus Nomurabacteria bacterium]